MPDVDFEKHHALIQEQGYTILENAIEPELVAAIAADLERLEKELAIDEGKNPFEGFKTVRIYNLLVHGETFESVPVHANVLPLAERVLDPGLLVSSLSSIAIGADEAPQPLHADDQLIPLPKPHVPLVCNSIWAITDFTDANGATRVVPRSHRAEKSPNPFEAHDTIPAEMPAGSVLVYHGSLWHGGGANRTAARRVGLAMNYCVGWVRQQENQQLGIPRDIARGFAPRLRELVGYGVYNHLIGPIAKQSPVALLDAGADVRMVWDIKKP
ncbi:MAG: phytanoyl-CoA dioxygenase family protein [Deltaproteobacteria bacterium]|nr:phytanoyl-CoA dioxygenase family protein [Deltaproteobacteria bacterium]